MSSPRQAWFGHMKIKILSAGQLTGVIYFGGERGITSSLRSSVIPGGELQTHQITFPLRGIFVL
jgi:hypothetical protein